MMVFENSLYHTVAANEDGLPGRSWIDENGTLDEKVTSPLSAEDGANPEQFVSLALVTCLSATLQAIEKRDGVPHTSQVRVRTDMMNDDHGYMFKVLAQVRIPGLGLDKAKAMFELAEARCPVSKLMQESDNVEIQLVDEFDI